MRSKLFATLAVAALACCAQDAKPQDWQPLFNGKNLDGWEVRGDSAWTVLPDGVLLGQRTHKSPARTFEGAWPVDQKRFAGWVYNQAWLYTTRDYAQYDLHVEYIVPPGVNSGISLCDRSRAHTAIGESDAARPELAQYAKTTPSHIGYEIQIIDGEEKNPSGSIYNLVPSRNVKQNVGAWNTLDIEFRNDHIRVRVNGEVVAEGPTDPARFKTGPIGIQMHDQFSFALFRNIRIREVK